jgi:hypothetical protein
MHVTGFVTVALAVALVTRCFAEVEVNSGVYLERLPAVNLYEASSPLLFYVNLTKLINVYCPVPCNVVMCDVLRKPEFIPFTMQPQETDGSILENDGQEETYQLVNKAHVKRLFTNEKELQKLQEQLRIRNITWREVPLPMGFTRQPVSLCEARAEAWVETLFIKSLVSNLLQMCQTKKMRPDIVPFNTLETILKKYTSVWSSIGYIPSLPELSKYYDVPLVECVLTRKHAVIGIHAPLIRKSTPKLEIRRLITPPFAWGRQTCSIDLTVADLIFPTEKVVSTVFIPRCDPLRENTCFLSEPSGEYMSTIICAKLVMNGATVQTLAEHCPLRCQETGQDVQYVTPLAENQFLITHPPRNLSVTCNGQQSSLKKNSSVGTLFVHLPYGCSLSPINGGRLQPRDQRVATPGAAITHRTIIPAAWVKIRSMNVPRYQEPKPLFQALDDCLNHKWLQDYQLQETNPASFHPFLLSVLDILLLVIIVGVFWYLRRTITTFEQAMYQYVESRITARLRGHNHPTLDMDTVRHRPPQRLPIPITEAQGPITHPGSPARSTSPLLSRSATPTLGQPEYVSMDPYVRPIQWA